MNLPETAKLLTLCSVYDGRGEVDEATVRAWHEILHDLPAQEAAQAVIEHYRESTKWVMPSDIRKRVAAVRDAQRDREQHLALTAAMEEAAAQSFPVRDGIRMVTESLAIRRKTDPEQATRDAEQRSRARSVTCPWCKAGPYQPCVIPGIYDERGNPQELKAPAHPSRVEAASEVAA